MKKMLLMSVLGLVLLAGTFTTTAQAAHARNYSGTGYRSYSGYYPRNYSYRPYSYGFDFSYGPRYYGPRYYSPYDGYGMRYYGGYGLPSYGGYGYYGYPGYGCDW